MKCLCPHARNTAGTLFRSGWDARCPIHRANDPWTPEASMFETFVASDAIRVMTAEDIGLLPHHPQ